MDKNRNAMKQENNSDFSHNNSSAEIKPSKHRFTKILIPVVSFCILFGTAAIVVPIAIDKSNQQKELVFDTSLDEFLSCCFNYSLHRNADAEPPPKTTVTSIYDAYRNNSDWMNEIRKTCETYTLHEEKAYHCVYAKKEICDIVNEIDHSDYYSFPQTPISGTTVFVDLCKYGPLDFETESKLLKERIYPDDSIYVDFQIDDDYYLLDVVKYYKDPNYNNYFVDFTNFSMDNP